MNEELKAHKIRDKFRWTLTGIAFVLVFVMLAGILMQIFGKGKVKPSEWFKKSETEQTTPVEDTTAVIINGESRGMELCSMVLPASAYAENGIDPQSAGQVFELSVTYTPANTTFQETDYTIAFKNPSSEWASGKTLSDYATITHEEYSKNAVLTVKQAFGEQIEVKAISHYDTTKFATFTVDYLSEYFYTNIGSSWDFESSNYFSQNSFSTGTLNPALNNTVTAVIDFSYLSEELKAYNINLPATYETAAFSEDVINSGDDVVDPYGILFNWFGKNKSESEKLEFRKALCHIWGDSVKNKVFMGKINFKINRVYNGVEYGAKMDETKWTDMNVGNADIDIAVAATSMSANTPNIIAG